VGNQPPEVKLSKISRAREGGGTRDQESLGSSRGKRGVVDDKTENKRKNSAIEEMLSGGKRWGRRRHEKLSVQRELETTTKGTKFGPSEENRYLRSQ